MFIDAHTTWLTPARHVPSPNHNERPRGVPISLLVIHNISLPPGQFGQQHIDAFFTNRLDAAAHPYFADIIHLQVSAHCLINRSGAVTQYVPFAKRAWHAGDSFFGNLNDCNNFSIGIELEGTDEVPYTKAQYAKLCRLTRLLMKTYPAITLDRIVGHSDIAPGRKTDPGPAFDWERLTKWLQTNDNV